MEIMCSIPMSRSRNFYATTSHDIRSSTSDVIINDEDEHVNLVA